MFEGFLISIPGITTVLLLVALWQWRRRRTLIRLAEANGACKLCQTPFSEAQIEYAGRITRAERAKLDRFQARFAAWKLVCHECGAINLCTRDGIAFAATVPREG